MRIRIRRWLYLVYAISILVGFATYLRGFMALKSPVEGYASWKNNPVEPNGSGAHGFSETFQRLVIILIDALRADFVLPLKGTALPQMPFVRSLITENRTLSFLSKAHPPTVTLPRIKALTTGDIPGFVDVVMNFDSAALKEDNIIHQLKRNGKKIVFYGDDTWIRLFPDEFLRTDGTTSFFVTDYTEVDNNVTRHLDAELSTKDWDVLILHYLGLDHIGHLAGPFSPLIKPKLNEMDSIVQRVYDSLLKHDVASGERSLLLLCGDHGMSDHGSHGGSSTHEVNTPFVFLSSLWDGRTGIPFSADEPVSQVDLVPTLALLFGVPIPQNSLGNVIPAVFQAHQVRHQLSALYINSRQLLNVFKENVPNWDKDPAYILLSHTLAAHETFISGDHANKASSQRLGLSIQAKYIKALRGFRERIAESLTRYDLHAMAIGIVILWLALWNLVLHGVQKTNPNQTAAHVGLISLISVASLLASHIVLCTSTYASPVLCDSGLPHLIIPVLITATVSLLCLCLNTSYADFSDLKIYHASPLCCFLLLGTIIHTVTLMASSFVEEEHQTWYFLTSTLPAFFLLHMMSSPGKIDTSKPSTENDTCSNQYSPDTPMGEEEYYLQIQEINHFHGEVFNRSRMNKNKVVVKKESARSKFSLDSYPDVVTGFLLLGLLLLSLRVARAWNRTGDKWAHLPDIGDWLVRPDNKVELSLLCALSLCGVCTLRWRRSCSGFASNLLLAGVSGVYLFRAANGALSFPWFYGENIEKGITEARITYSIILGLFLHATSTYRKSKSLETDNQKDQPEKYRRSIFFSHFQLAWTLLMLLLYRPHNIPLVFLITLMEVCLRKVVLLTGNSLPTWAITLIYMWMGHATFFFQGNSNSISTVDVSAGYVGLVDYRPLIIGLLMCLSTYAGHIFWIISLLRTLSECIQERTHQHGKWRYMVEEVVRTLMLTRALPLAVYTCLTTLQRYHLFVWTVFSPKLLYEGMLTVVLVSITFFLQLVRTLT